MACSFYTWKYQPQTQQKHVGYRLGLISLTTFFNYLVFWKERIEKNTVIFYSKITANFATWTGFEGKIQNSHANIVAADFPMPNGQNGDQEQSEIYSDQHYKG